MIRSWKYASSHTETCYTDIADILEIEKAIKFCNEIIHIRVSALKSSKQVDSRLGTALVFGHCVLES